MSSTELLGSLQTHAVPAIVDRRSAHLLLEDLWYRDREYYWKCLLDMMMLGRPGLSRIVFAQSVTRLASDDQDLFPLLEGVRNTDTRDSALHALRFVCNYVSADPREVRPSPWLRMCGEIRLGDEDDVITHCATILQRIWNGRLELEPNQRAVAAQAARRLWSVSMQRNLVALKAVIDTFSEDVATGEAAFDPLFEPAIANPSRELALEELTREIKELLGAPELVSRLYERAIRAEADAEAKQRHEVLIWSQQSARADQEGEDVPSFPRSATAANLGAQFWLEQYMSQFLESAPKRAARCVAESAIYWERTTDVFRTTDVQRIPLTVDGKVFLIETRDVEGREHSLHLIDKLVEALMDQLIHRDVETREAILATLVDVPAPATIWSSVIDTAAHDDWLRQRIGVVVLGSEAIRLFSRSVARLLIESGSELPASWLEQIERNVANFGDDEGYAKLQIERALQMVKARNASAEAPGDRKPTSGTAVPDDYVAAIEEVDFEMRQLNLDKADLEEPVNARIWDTKKAAAAIADKLTQQSAPDVMQTADIQSATKALDDLREALQAPDAHAGIVTSGWCTLARLASLIQALAEPSDPSFLLAAARRMDGLPWQRSDGFNNLLNAKQAFPRAEAVRGLLMLVSRNADANAIGLVEQLLRDPEPAVRFQIAYNLPMLIAVEHDKLWPIVERLLRDSSVSVAAAAVHNLGPFYGIDRDRTLALCISVLDRFVGGDDTPLRARADALIQVCWYYLTQAHPQASAAIDDIINKIPSTVNGLDAVLHNYRPWLIMGSGDGDDDALEENARRRTVDLYVRFGTAAVGALLSGNRERDANAAQRTERDPCAVFLENLAMQLYFATGAFQEEKQGAARLAPLVIARLYAEICEFLVVLGTAGSAAAGNKVLDAFEYFFRVARECSSIQSADVLERFILVARSLIGATGTGSYWKLEAIERVLRRCIAERDPSLSNEEVLLAWGSILDPLLEQGWKQAFLLARDLDVSS